MPKFWHIHWLLVGCDFLPDIGGAARSGQSLPLALDHGPFHHGFVDHLGLLRAVGLRQDLGRSKLVRDILQGQEHVQGVGREVEGGPLLGEQARTVHVPGRSILGTGKCIIIGIPPMIKSNRIYVRYDSYVHKVVEVSAPLKVSLRFHLITRPWMPLWHADVTRNCHIRFTF